MAKTALKEEEFNFPAGGIADFYMEDDEIAALEQAEAKEAFGESGIANFEEIAGRMASYGRYGDDTVAHVETGELIIPKALIEDNPKLRDSIFGHLEEMGIEDPERYVVGSGANSINPDTGLPEFFFKAIKKAVSKVVKGVTKAVKKVVKKVGKVIKKVAPVILPIALAFTPLGPVYGAALGSGIGTLIQGGDIKDAFKSALIAGGTGALFSGVSSKLAGGTFTGGVKAAVANPGARLGQTLAGAKSTFSGQGFTGEGNLFTEYVPTSTIDAPGQAIDSVKEGTQLPEVTKVSGEATVGDLTGQGDAFQMAQEMNLPFDPATNTYQYATDAGTVTIGKGTTIADMNAQIQALQGPVTEPSFLDTVGQKAETVGDYMFRGGQSQESINIAKGVAEQKAVQDTLTRYGFENMAQAPVAVQNAAIEAGKAAAAAAGPGLLAKFGPSIALGTAGLAATGFFTAPEQEELDIASVQGPTGSDLIAEDPNKYLVGGSQVTGATGPYSVASNYAYNPQTGTYNINPFGAPQYVADGGEIFPRRNGGIMPDEGIPNQDSVRAMLMPGEFVMTTDAVRGLGNGNLRQGINNMYGVMRNLEARGKAMA